MDGERCYFFTLEIEPMEVGDIYEVMPLHCTLMPRFFSHLPPDDLIDQVQTLLEQTKPISLIPMERTAFGPHRVMAAMIKTTPTVLELHAALYYQLKQLDVRNTETDWVGPGYLPHVTDQANSVLPINKAFRSRAIYLIEVEHPLDGKRRFIRSKIDLSFQATRTL